MGLLTSLRAKLETSRLQRQYTQRREKRTTFCSGAQYLDGEYVYSTSTSTTSTHPTRPTHSHSHTFPSSASFLPPPDLTSRRTEPSPRFSSPTRTRWHGQQDGEFSEQWENSQARVPSVRVTEAFGGAGRGTRAVGDRGDMEPRRGTLRVC